MYEQPAFGLPPLKNHKIQLSSSFLMHSNNGKPPYIDKVFKAEQLIKGCPPGKVPLKRMKVNHIRNGNSSSESKSEHFHKFSRDQARHHYCTLNSIPNTTYHGASSFISLSNPPVKSNQFSKAVIWVENGPPNELNNIDVGWAVHPRIYGDYGTHLTAYWTTDGYRKSGCYNMMCPGFIQVHPTLHLGFRFPNTSTIGGKQYVTLVSIKQDPTTGNWWLLTQDGQVGYWPKEIFTHLANGTSSVRYGGVTLVSPDGISPPMGSGELPSPTYGRACYFAGVLIVDSEFNEKYIDPKNMKRYCDTRSDCYDLLYFQFQAGGHKTQFFNFGGPGGRCSRNKGNLF